jgi:hypothetical protein
MGGRRPKSKSEMQMTGAAAKHPERMEGRGDQPKPEGPLGPPPAYFMLEPRCRYCGCGFGSCELPNGGRCAQFGSGRPDVCTSLRCLETYRIQDGYRAPDVDYAEAARLRAIWFELAEQVPAGMLTVSDRMHVELTCRLMDRVRTCSAKSGDYSRLDILLGKMGMNPADRSRVTLAPGAGTGAGVAVKRSDGGDSANRGNTFKDIAQETAAVRPN